MAPIWRARFPQITLGDAADAKSAFSKKIAQFVATSRNMKRKSPAPEIHPSNGDGERGFSLKMKQFALHQRTI